MTVKCFWIRSQLGLMLLAGAVVLVSCPASALTVAFLLNNITYSNTSDLFGVTTGNGLISWTYTAGDFQNGNGSYVFVNLPPYTVPPSGAYVPIYTVDSVSVTGTITQNVDSYAYDYAINFSPALTTPNSMANIISGTYNLTGSVPNFGFNGPFGGQVIGGTVTPYRPALSLQTSGTNIIVQWPPNYADGFVLESTTSLNPGGLWVTSSIPATVHGQNFVLTNSLANGANVFFRLVL